MSANLSLKPHGCSCLHKDHLYRHRHCHLYNKKRCEDRSALVQASLIDAPGARPTATSWSLVSVRSGAIRVVCNGGPLIDLEPWVLQRPYGESGSGRLLLFEDSLQACVTPKPCERRHRSTRTTDYLLYPSATIPCCCIYPPTGHDYNIKKTLPKKVVLVASSVSDRGLITIQTHLTPVPHRHRALAIG